MKMMKKILVMASAVLIAGSAFASGGGYKNADKVGKNTERLQLLWLINGTKNTYDCVIPATDRGTVDATCHNHDLIDLKTNKIIGTAVDATADVDAVENGFVGTGTTFFYLKNGSLVVRGRGSIQPVLVDGSPMIEDRPVTHIAGIFAEPGANNVLSGTGVFKNATGTFTLLGALDLANSANGQQSFHCLYEIELELNRDDD